MAESVLSKLDDVLRKTSRSSQIAITVAGLGAFYAIKRYFTPSPFDSIRGPPSPSFLTGHLLPLTSGKGDTSYCTNLTNQYGSIVKLNALLGVRPGPSFVCLYLLTLGYRATCYMYPTRLLCFIS